MQASVQWPRSNPRLRFRVLKRKRWRYWVRTSASCGAAIRDGIPLRRLGAVQSSCKHPRPLSVPIHEAPIPGILLRKDIVVRVTPDDKVAEWHAFSFCDGVEQAYERPGEIRFMLVQHQRQMPRAHPQQASYRIYTDAFDEPGQHLRIEMPLPGDMSAKHSAGVHASLYGRFDVIASYTSHTAPIFAGRLI